MTVTNFFMGFLFLIIFLTISSGLGTVINKRSAHFSSNAFMIMPIGFLVFFGVTFLAYLPFIFIDVNLIALASVELIKDVLLTYYIFYRIRGLVKYWLKILWQLLLGLVLFAGFFLIIQWLASNTHNTANQIGYNGWMKFNINARTLQSFDWYTGEPVANYGNAYFSQTWYYFNTIIVLSFNLNINVMMFWIDGVILYVFAISAILALFTCFIRQKLIVKLLYTVILLSFLTFIGHYNEPPIVGLEMQTFCFVMLLTFFTYFVKTNDRNLVYWINATLIMAWSFSSSALFIWAFFYWAVILYMVFQKMQDVFAVSVLLIFPAFGVCALYFYYSSILIFLIFIAGMLVLGLLYYNTRLWSNKQLLTVDTWFVQRKWWLLFVPIAITFGLSMFFFIRGDISRWLNFEPSGDGLQPGGNKSALNIWGTYASYWAIFALLIFLSFAKFKKINYLYPLIFTTTVATLSFYNPLVSGFINGEIVPGSAYHGVRTNFFIPFFFGVAIYGLHTLRINWNIMLGNVLTILALVPPVAMNASQIVMNSFANPTAIKGIGRVAQYLNNLNLRDKDGKPIPIDGDVRGLRALTSIPYASHTQDSLLYYNHINYQFFSDHPRYNFGTNFPGSDQPNAPYIMVKLTENVDPTFDETDLPTSKTFYELVGFTNLITFDYYSIYIPPSGSSTNF